MRKLVGIHNRVFSSLESNFSGFLIPSLARFAFASALFLFFWNSAKTKIGDSIIDITSGAYIQIFPKKFDAVGYDASQMSSLDSLIVLMGTYAEFILPVLIVIGLLTRLASLAMIGFIVVMSYVDVTGHGVDAGNMFDGQAYDLIMDQRLFWIFALIVLVLKGAGPISADAAYKKLFGK